MLKLIGWMTTGRPERLALCRPSNALQTGSLHQHKACGHFGFKLVKFSCLERFFRPAVPSRRRRGVCVSRIGQ